MAEQSSRRERLRHRALSLRGQWMELLPQSDEVALFGVVAALLEIQRLNDKGLRYAELLMEVESGGV